MGELTITEGRETFEICCPSCNEGFATIKADGGCEGKAPYFDGDCIPLADSLRSAGTEPLDAELLALDCSACGAHLYSVAVLIGSEKTARPFAFEEFEGEPSAKLLLVRNNDAHWYCLSYDDVKLRDAMTGTALPQRRVHWHHMGPYLSREPLTGPHGVSSCGETSPAWDHARRLVADELPGLRACLLSSLEPQAEQAESDAAHRRTNRSHPAR